MQFLGLIPVLHMGKAKSLHSYIKFALVCNRNITYEICVPTYKWVSIEAIHTQFTVLSCVAMSAVITHRAIGGCVEKAGWTKGPVGCGAFTRQTGYATCGITKESWLALLTVYSHTISCAVKAYSSGWLTLKR